MNLRRLFYITGSLGLLAGIVTVAPPVSATFSGNNGRVAFTKEVNGVSSIWSMEPQSKYMKRVKKGAHNPVWSPNGRQLIVVGVDNHLWMMNANGHMQRRLTHTWGYADRSPVWSMDGLRIAFIREETTGAKRNAVFTIKTDGTEEVNITGWAHYRSPSWSPDGSELAYEQYGEDENTLHIRSLKMNSTRTLTTLSEPVESNVSWSPSGKKLLYSDSSNEVYTIWPDGSHRTVISDGDSYYASWSPDGKRIAFIEDPEDDHISISEEDGTVIWVPIEKEGYQAIGVPLWSPDGTALLFTMSRQEAGNTKIDTFLLELNGGVLVKLAGGELLEADWQAKQ